MITEIYVENYKIDATSDIDALLSFAIDDVKDFASRNTSYSKTLVLPGTSQNNRTFANVFSINQSGQYNPSLTNINDNYNISKSASCIIFQGNIQVFKGVIRILEIIIDNGSIEYECAVFGELGGLIDKLGALLLEDLDFSAHDHNYNLTNIVDSWDHAADGTGYYYPNIDYGTYSVNKHDWQFNTFRPALFAKEYIDKIFANAGYAYSSTLFSTSRFKSLIIPHNQKGFVKNTSHLISANILTPGYSVFHDSSASSNINFANYPILSSFTHVLGVWTYTGVDPVSLNLTFDVSGTYYSTDNDIYFTLYRNGTSMGVIGGSGWLTNTAGSTTPVEFSFSYSNMISLNSGDTFHFTTEIVTASGSYDVTIDTANLVGDSTVPMLVDVNLGDDIEMHYSIPKNILQKEFLASIIKLFNLYIYEDKYNKNLLNIAPYVDFFDTNPANAIDWTYKMDRSQPISIKPMSELTSRYYEMKYKEDADYFNNQYKTRYNLSYGSYIFDTLYEFAQESNTAELIFSGTPLVGYGGEDKVYPTIYKKSGIVEETIDSNIRIMLAKKVTGVTSWDIMSGVTVLGSYTDYGYAGHFDDPDLPANDLNFGMPHELFFTVVSGAFNVNQFNVYWLPYMYEITDQDSRLLTATFRLNEQDINTLDFSKLIWIDGILFRLNKIIDYNASDRDTCKAELIKVINLKY
jgi:hypothetical protein